MTRRRFGTEGSKRHPRSPTRSFKPAALCKKIFYSKTLFTNVWPMYKVQKTPPSHPHLPPAVSTQGARPPVSCPWLRARASRGGASGAGARPALTAAGYATVLRPLPGPTAPRREAEMGSHPAPGVRARGCVAAVSRCRAFPGSEGICPASPECPSSPTTSWTSLPLSCKPDRRGKEAGAPWEGGDMSRDVAERGQQHYAAGGGGGGAGRP